MVLVEGTGEIGLAPGAFAIVSTANHSSAPELACPAAETAYFEANGRPPLSCWVQTDLVDPVLAPRLVQIPPVCVDRYPFPGSGAAYTRDGMTAWEALRLQELFGQGGLGGRRLCTASELQAAVAGLSDNRPVLTGDVWDFWACPPEGPIGASPTCTNSATGVFDYFSVHAHWVTADAAFVAAACPQPPCKAAGNRPLRPGMFLVLGGTGRNQTRQAPHTPHTWHDHGAPTAAGCDQMGHDDQPAICADPDEGWVKADPRLLAEEARYQTLLSVARTTGSMNQFLEAGLGRPLCAGE